MRLALDTESCIHYIKKIEIGNYIWKKRFCYFSIFTCSYYEQNADAWGPIFLRTIYSQHTYKVRYDSEQRQLAFKYEMRNPESGADDGKEENDGMLVLKI